MTLGRTSRITSHPIQRIHTFRPARADRAAPRKEKPVATKDEILSTYHRHNQFVRDAIPADRLLVFDVKQGWEPLCHYLGVPVPATDFPRTNNTQDFWASTQAG